MKRVRVLVALALLSSSVLCASAQQQGGPFAHLDPLAVSNRARDVFRAQRDEYVEKYTTAEIYLGLMLEENKKLQAYVVELEAKLKAASPPPAAPSENEP